MPAKPLTHSEVLILGDEVFCRAANEAIGRDTGPCAPVVWEDVESALTEGSKVILLSGDHHDASYVLCRLRSRPDTQGVIVLWCESESDSCRITPEELRRLNASRLVMPIDPADVVVALAEGGYELQ